MNMPGFTAEWALSIQSDYPGVWSASSGTAVTMAYCAGQLVCEQVPTTVCECVAAPTTCPIAKPWCGCLQECASPFSCYLCNRANRNNN